MSIRSTPRRAFVALLAAVAWLPAPALAVTYALTPYVNPFIGTDDSTVPNPVGGGAGGSTYPGATVPFGMVQLSPDTPTASPSGYRYKDGSIEDFSLTHFDGAGCANNEDVNMMPVTRYLTGNSPGTGWTSYASTYAKASEKAVPGYYAVKLDTPNTLVELTATRRAGMARVTYPVTNNTSWLVNVSRMATGNRSGTVSIVGSNTIEGTTTGGGFCGGGTFTVYFSIVFDRDFQSFGTWSGGTLSVGSRSASGTQAGGWATWDASTNQVVRLKVGLSYVSVANARLNRDTEIPGWDFDAVRAAADTAWNDALNRIQVTSGGTAADLQQFYTALYHVFQSPNVASDVNGQYMGFDYAVHTSGRPVYQNYSGWDIYRSWTALAALVAPETSDILQSMVLDGQQGGLLPKWSHQNVEDWIMNGDPGPIIVASGYAFGARSFDTAGALALMKKVGGTVGATMQGRATRGRLADLLSYHYLPGDCSDSVEYTASDFAIAQFAGAMGDTATYASYMTRAQYWANVFSTTSSYIQNRNANGSWVWPVNPADPSGYTEGNPAQYAWLVPWNFGSLANLMGGRQTVVQRLDHLFTQVNAGLNQPYFYIGNEPEHDQPWAYNYVGAPWGAQSAVRRIMQGAFSTGPGGLPGNDDLGATSAWYVWAALGLFPVSPGTDVLALHGPLFARVTVNLANGKVLQIDGAGAGDGSPYVQNLTVNSSSASRTWLRYPDVAGGATLSFTMGTSPNTTWGSSPADAPPSFNDGWTPPATAPDYGTNLALGRTATGSAACASTETPAKAVDGALMNNSKFCSGASPAWLQVDLGSVRTVSHFVVKHAGLGGETTGWNTGAFTLQTSTDGTAWTTVVTVSGNTASRTAHDIAARSARYVKLNVTTPTNNGNGATRIYELEVY